MRVHTCHKLLVGRLCFYSGVQRFEDGMLVARVWVYYMDGGIANGGVGLA